MRHEPRSPLSLRLRTFRSSAVAVVLGAVAVTSGLACTRSTPSSTTSAPPPVTPAAKVAETGAFGGLPVAFEQNLGQADDEVAFLSRGGSSTLFLTKKGEAVFVMSRAEKTSAKPAGTRRDKAKLAAEKETSVALRMKLAGASAGATVLGGSELPGRANYLVGDVSKHHTNVPRFERVEIKNAYDGIDVVYYGGKDHALEYDFVVKSGHDPRQIGLSFEGADHVSLEKNGEITVTVGKDTVRLKAPVSYQTKDGVRRAVESRYELVDGTVRFHLGAYDPSLDLVIDPLINFSSYFGGSGIERVTCLARDAAGNFYLSGSTSSANLPKTNPIPDQITLRGATDAFVTKLNPTGSQVLYSTYLGGTGEEYMTDFVVGLVSGAMRTCAVDATGRAHVATTTLSTDFPVTAGAFDTTFEGGIDVTLTRLNAAGNALEYSTFIGGSSSEYWPVIALEPSGHVWVSGHTASSDFPVKSPTQAVRGNLVDTSDIDTFLVRVTPDGSGTTFGTFLGGSKPEYPFDIALDSAQNPIIVGATASVNYPTTLGTVQPLFAGGDSGVLPHADGYVTKYNLQANGTATLAFSTYLGGSGLEIAQAVAVGADNSIYVGGVTTSLDFPGQVGRPGSASPFFDGFVVKLNPTATTRAFSRLFGQDDLDGVYDVAVNAAGNMFVAGTGTLGNTTVNGCGKPGDKGILGMLKADGSGWEYLTPFGEVNSQILVDNADTAYVAGWGATGSIPVVGTVAQPTYGGGASDAYLIKLAKLPNANVPGCAPCTGDFGTAGANACTAALPQCQPTGECVGPCATDTDCGNATSGRVCVASACKDGCRGTGGNGCAAGRVCSSTTNAVGTCSTPADAGTDASLDSSVRDAAQPPTDAAQPVADAAQPGRDAAPIGDPPNDDGKLEGGGLSCSSSPMDTGASGSAALGLGLVAAALVGRMRRRDG